VYYSISQAAFLMGVCSTTLRRWDKQGSIKCVRTVGNHRRIHISEVQRIIDGKKRRYINKNRGVVLYARVSSHEQKQKGDLDRQISRLRDYVDQNLTSKKIKTNNNKTTSNIVNNTNKTTSNIKNNTNKTTSNIENNTNKTTSNIENYNNNNNNNNKTNQIYELSDVASGLNTKRIGLLKLFTLVQKGKISHVFITYPDRLTRFGFEYLKWYFGSYGVTIHCLEENEQKSVQDEMVDDLIAIITSFSGKIHGMRSGKKKKEMKK
jgi:excisionase family DNA binding protein